LIRLGYCLGVKSVVSIKETIMYQLEASKKNPKSSQSLQREGDEQVLRAIPSSTPTVMSKFSNPACSISKHVKSVKEGWRVVCFNYDRNASMSQELSFFLVF